MGLLVLPAIGGDLALDVELGALLHVVAHDLGGAVEGLQVVPFGVILPVALRILLAVLVARARLAPWCRRGWNGFRGPLPTIAANG